MENNYHLGNLREKLVEGIRKDLCGEDWHLDMKIKELLDERLQYPKVPDNPYNKK